MRPVHLLLALVLLSMAGWWIAVTWNCFECMTFQSHRHKSQERPASTCLKMIASAQADFRANDRDTDGQNQFWRADIAGLYALAPGGGPAIKLIPYDLALADARPAYDISGNGKRQPRAGYWFKQIRHPDETRIDPFTRFAACAYPADVSKHKYTFIVNDNNTIFRTATPLPAGIDVWPTDEEMKAQWSKLD